MKTITLTERQAIALAERHNAMVKDAYKIQPEQAHLLFTGNSAQDLADHGEYWYAISEYKTPDYELEILDIHKWEVTLNEQ